MNEKTSQRLQRLSQQHKGALEELLVKARALHGPDVELELEEGTEGVPLLMLHYPSSHQTGTDLPPGVGMHLELVVVVVLKGDLGQTVPALQERLDKLPAVHVVPRVQTHPS